MYTVKGPFGATLHPLVQAPGCPLKATCGPGSVPVSLTDTLLKPACSA